MRYAVRFQLVDLLVQFGGLPIRHGLWKETRLVNFSFLPIETLFFLGFVRKLRQVAWLMNHSLLMLKISVPPPLDLILDRHTS